MKSSQRIIRPSTRHTFEMHERLDMQVNYFLYSIGISFPLKINKNRNRQNQIFLLALTGIAGSEISRKIESVLSNISSPCQKNYLMHFSLNIRISYRILTQNLKNCDRSVSHSRPVK